MHVHALIFWPTPYLTEITFVNCYYRLSVGDTAHCTVQGLTDKATCSHPSAEK